MEHVFFGLMVSLGLGALYFVYDSARTEHNFPLKMEALDIAASYGLFLIHNESAKVTLLEDVVNLGRGRNNPFFWAKSYMDFINPEHRANLSKYGEVFIRSNAWHN